MNVHIEVQTLNKPLWFLLQTAERADEARKVFAQSIRWKQLN